MRNSRNRNKGLTRVGLIVVCSILFFLLFIVFITPPLAPVRPIAKRVVCGTNLKGLGTAISVYANDYDGYAPQLRGHGPWSKELGYNFDLEKPDFEGEQREAGRTITASWYLLIREADVSPKSFICPNSKEKEFSGENPKNLDVVNLWDFGSSPHDHVSYVMHNPYGKYPAHELRSAAFAVAADMNPWMKKGDFVSKPSEYGYPQIITANDEDSYKYGNSLYHPKQVKGSFGRYKDVKGTGESQHVVYADGHSANEKQPNCGVRNDNIYTYWSAEVDPSDQDIQGGTAPTGRDASNDAKSEGDSFLVL